MMTVLSKDWGPNDGMLHVGHWGIVCVKSERSRQVDGIYLLYLDSLYPHHDQPITSLATITLYSANPLVDLKTHTGTSTVELFLCHDSHNPLCL